MFCRDIWALILARSSLKTQFLCKRVCRLVNAPLNVTSWPDEFPRLSGGIPFPWLTWMLYRYPEKGWDYKGMSGNRLLTWDYVWEHREKGWDWSLMVEKSPYVTEAEVKTMADFGIVVHMFHLCCNPNYTFRQLVALGAHWRYLSWAADLTWERVEENLDKPWSWTTLSQRAFVMPEIVERYPSLPWDWSGGLSKNPNLTTAFIERNSTRPWNMVSLSLHPCLTWDFVVSYPEMGWWRESLMHNSCFPFSIQMANRDMFSFIGSSNPTWEECQTYPLSIPVFLAYVSGTFANWLKITESKMFGALADGKIWNLLSSNKAISWTIVQENPHLPWNFAKIHYKSL